MIFPVGTIVDLYDPGFKQWRGEYIVMKHGLNGLHKIKNTRTNSQQFVKETALRMGRLGQFRVHSLYEEK
jgi:hypothetical protein